MTTALQLEFHRLTINGMQVLLAPRCGSGLIATTAWMRRGSADEAEGEHGLASFTTGMLLRGTRKRSNEQLAYDLESLGAMASEADGMDGCSVSLRAAAEEMPEALEIIFEVLREPAFDAQEHERYREEMLAHLRMQEDEKFGYTYREYLKRMFAGHGYGHPSEGEMADVQKISPEACAQWHAGANRPESILFVAVGDFEADSYAELLTKLTDKWPSAGAVRPRTEAHAAAKHQDLLELHKPDLQQGFIVSGYPTPGLTHPDYAALRLASAALGEGFGGRIFTNLRDHKSLAYALGSSLRPYRLGGHQILYIGTKPETIDEARDGLMEEAEYLRNTLLTEDELERAREYVIGKFLVGQQSLAARAGTLAWWEDTAGDARLATGWVDRLKAVTTKEIREAANAWWKDPVVAILRPE